MNRWVTVTSAVVVAGLLATGVAVGQQPRSKDCDPSRVPQKIEGQVIRVDPKTNKITIRDSKGTVHEFQSNEQTVKDVKPGDRIEAQLRQAPNC